MDSRPMRINICKLHPLAQTPGYATEGAACFDLHAIEHCEVAPMGGSATVRTGLAFEIPADHVMLIFSRSGHGFKHSVRLANCVGVIDADYRGEVMVRLHNDGHIRFSHEIGDRIAQAMLLPVRQVAFDAVEQLSLTERGTGGMGSTGQ